MQLTEYPDTGGDLPLALIVDDDDADRYRLTKMCRKAGLDFAFHEAEGLKRMKALMDARRFDIVFLDYWLGIESGQEALELLRAHPNQRDAVVIMVSSVSRHDVVIEAMRSGCDDYLVKEELGLDAIRKSVANAFERRLVRRSHGARGRRLVELESRIQRVGAGFTPDMRTVLLRLLRRISAATLRDDAGPWRPDHHEMTEMCLNGLTALGEIEGVCREALPPADEKRDRFADCHSGSMTGRIS
ncbi:putative PAS/PAC sensor protein [Citreicella sp. 357]|nr:putative PAS/PAC sensor protein [Citreicella sp. 357]